MDARTVLKERKFPELLFPTALMINVPETWKSKNKEDIIASIFNPTKRKNQTRNFKHAWSEMFDFDNFLVNVLH